VIESIIIFIGVLGVLVVSHELGHFIVARAGGITVHTFSVGFGPKFLRVRRGGTEYALSWIPFGGYVKMAGENPEPDAEDEDAPEGTRFSDKSVGVRAAVVAAGPFMNYLLALGIFVFFFWRVGLDVIDTRTVHDVAPDSPAAAAGVEPGDQIVSLGGRTIGTWMDLLDDLAELPAGPTQLVVTREGADLTLNVDLPAKDESVRLGVTPRMPPRVGTVKRGGVADRAGLREGDRIQAVDGKPVGSWSELVDIVHGSAGKEITLTWSHQGEIHHASVVPEKETVVTENETREVGLIGITSHMDRIPQPLARAVTLGWRETNGWCGQVLGVLRLAVRGKLRKDMVGGPLRIGELAAESFRWGWESLIRFIAILSVHLAVLNLLPIPILDGGQLFLLLPEAVLRRPLSLKQRLVLQQIGFAVVILLMVAVTVLDVGRLLQR
jgi:regulator of sigma E protease